VSVYIDMPHLNDKEDIKTHRLKQHLTRNMESIIRLSLFFDDSIYYISEIYDNLYYDVKIGPKWKDARINKVVKNYTKYKV
ncbi:hypothetical protein THOM_1148, partial [Trachipleistophora hominis]